MRDKSNYKHYENVSIRPQMETLTFQAESVAYTVCQHYGIDTSDYSFAYIAGWSQGKETPELKASLNTIRTAASEMISDIDSHMQELLQERAEKSAEKTEAAFRVGDHFLEIHEAVDGSWDFTVYGHNYREVDGGQIGEPGRMDLDHAAREVIDFYQLSGQPVTEMDRGLLAGLTELYDPAKSDEQIHFMGAMLEQGFDPQAFFVNGQPMDLTALRMASDQISEVQYQMRVDAIPKMLFTKEQWKEIEAGIKDHDDVWIYADPKFTPEQMKTLRKEKGHTAEQEAIKRPTVKKKAGKKSLMADLRGKQAQIAGSESGKQQVKSKSKEMD